jgi:hypothetical protein
MFTELLRIREKQGASVGRRALVSALGALRDSKPSEISVSRYFRVDGVERCRFCLASCCSSQRSSNRTAAVNS